MHIALVTPWSDERCAASDYAHTMVKYLSQRPELDKITVIAEKSAYTHTSFGKTHVSRTWETHNPLTLLQAVDKVSAQLVHLNFMYHRRSYGGLIGEPLLTFIILAKKLRKIPVIITVHDVWLQSSLKKWLCQVYGIPRAFALPLAAYTRIVTRYVLDAVDACVVFSRTQKVALLRQCLGSTPKIGFISHGCEDKRAYRKNRSELRKRFSLNEAPIIVVLGYIWERKGIEELIEAMEDIVKKFPEAILVIAGPLQGEVGYEYLRNLRRLADKVHLSSHVKIIPRMLEKEEMYMYSAMADVVFIARRIEALSTSGLYHIAVSTLTPVVAYPDPVMKEHMQVGGGLQLNSLEPSNIADKIIAVLNDGCLRQSTVEKMSIYADECLWPKIASQYVDLYSALL
jgi:glycosyltransferase involved in cell wall biosynthesis